jgi:hypothetical protein
MGINIEMAIRANMIATKIIIHTLSQSNTRIFQTTLVFMLFTHRISLSVAAKAFQWALRSLDKRPHFVALNCIRGHTILRQLSMQW